MVKMMMMRMRMTTHLITMPVESVLRGKYPLTLAAVELRGPAVTKTWHGGNKTKTIIQLTRTEAYLRKCNYL